MKPEPKPVEYNFLTHLNSATQKIIFDFNNFFLGYVYYRVDNRLILLMYKVDAVCTLGPKIL